MLATVCSLGVLMTTSYEYVFCVLLAEILVCMLAVIEFSVVNTSLVTVNKYTNYTMSIST